MLTYKSFNKVLNNKYLNYIILSFLILLLIIFSHLNDSTKNFIKKTIKNPNFMIILIMGVAVLSVFNFPLSILLSFVTLIVLSYKSNNVEGFKDKKSDRPHLFMKHFNIDTDSLTNELKKGLEENRKSKIKDGVKNLNKNNKKLKSNNLAIQKRKFDLQKDEDTNLLNTREICKDIINRINYEYEDISYLKKYIASRIEEIVDLNNLLEKEN